MALARKAAGLCSAAEEVIFQCAAAGKIIAVCAKGRGGAPAAVQYRYGSLTGVENAYPQNLAGSGSLTWAATGYSGGGEAQIRFVDGGREHVIYSRIVRTGFGRRGNNDPKEEAGFFIREGSKIRLRAECDMPGASIDLERAQALLPEGEMVYPDE